MDLKQIAYFTWIVEEGSIAAAASKANVVPPAISMQIKKLEQELAVRLLERGARGVTPTNAGRKLYEHCIRIAEEISEAKRELIGRDETGDLECRIKVGFTPVLSSAIIVPTIRRFQALYPKVRLSLTERYTGSAFDAVMSGEVDFAFGVTPSPMPGLAQRLIVSEEVVILSGRRIRDLRPYAVLDLASETDLDLILPSEKHSFGSLLQNYIAAGIINPRRTIEIDGAVTAHHLIRQSEWVLLSTHLERADRRDEDIYVYRIGNPQIPFTISLLYDHRRPLSVASTRFVRMVEEELKAKTLRRASVPGMEQKPS